MNSQDDERDDEKKGTGRPATKFMERPKPGQQEPSKSKDAEGGPDQDIGGEEYWGQGRQQKEQKDRPQQQGKQDSSED